MKLIDKQTTIALQNKDDAISVLMRAQKRNDRLLFMIVCATITLLTPLMVLTGIDTSIGVLLGIIAAVVVVTLVARWPLAGFFAITSCVVLIDQAPLLANVITDHLYVYYWPPALEGLIERPIGFLFLIILFAMICHRFYKRQQLLKGGALIVPFLLFLLCLAGGAFYGWTTGGDLKIIVVELRPFIYLFESYLVAYNLVSRKRHVRIFFWLVIVGAGVKALQGIYLYFIALHGQLGDNTLMSHEESFFFIGLLLLVVLLSLHGRNRTQLIAALCVLPFVIITLVLNDRRADYIALLAGLAVVWILMFLCKPSIRTLLVIIMLCGIVLGGAYVAVFANSTAGYALPARAVIAVFHPDPNDTRDAYSNLYRVIENYDLKFTIQRNNLLFGLGFGKPYLQPIPLTTVFQDIGAQDIYYGYVPHNNIYWVWMRLGAVGFLAFWYLIGSIIVRGAHIARQLRDRYLQLVAIYAVAITVMEIIVSFADYQLFYYRNVIYVGLLAGILMKLGELDEEKPGL
jgi:O-Antigen ligase